MYIIRKTETAPAADGNTQKPEWEKAETVDINTYPWYEKGKKQGTTARILYDDKALYLLFEARDRHSSSAVTDLNGPVSNDSCVEFFATHDPETGPHYWNIEINCCGTILVGHGPDRHKRSGIAPELVAGISVFHSVPGPVKEPKSDEEVWVIESIIPWKVLAGFAGIRKPESGIGWKVNFYRAGGKVDPQFCSWADIDTPKPDFHQPDYFKATVFE